ncbi:hypothetical protein FRB90_005724 [Tulasnella sp. 427]|nr:hypothetical protein FRB90_005724 [Tulasnella sp. 427]
MSSIAPSVLSALSSLDPNATYTQAGGPKVKSSKGDIFYVKTGGARYYDQWKGEAESLKAMHAAAPGICPRLIAFGEDEESKQKPYMISEYKEFSSLSSPSGKNLARRMALELHEPRNSEAGAKGKFGFQWPTYCGATRLENGWFDTWDEAYGSLIKTLLDNLRQEGRSYSEICDLGDQVVVKYTRNVFLFSIMKLTSLLIPELLHSYSVLLV